MAGVSEPERRQEVKRLHLFIIFLAVTGLSAIEIDPMESNRALNSGSHNSGNIGVTVSNYGYSSQMLYPITRQHKLLNVSAPWIGAKRYRRNDSGQLLYWLSPNPGQYNDTVVTQYDPQWNPSLKPVVDTLCTVGFDGDQDLFELLPAYNPLAWNSPQYSIYNSQDKVMKSILGSPAPRPFMIPDPQNNYCFSIPQGGNFDTPGFETLSAWFYDYSPLWAYASGDLGSSSNMNTHYPLGLAIHRESYTWNLQNYERVLIYKYTMINSSTVDTLYDIAIGEFVDADIHPVEQASLGAQDDTSGFVSGTGLNYAYSRDFDYDGGVTPYILAHKLILPGFSTNGGAWYWRLGDGPDDSDARSFNYAPQRTCNEKYWLLTGRNANDTKYVSLIPQQPESQYELPAPHETRYLNSVYGPQPSAAVPNPAGRIHLPPGQSLVWYSAYMVSNHLTDANLMAADLETFIIEDNLQIDPAAGLTCIPYLMPVQMVAEGSLQLDWHSYTDPHHFEVMYKLLDAPASDWTRINKTGSDRSHFLSGLSPTGWYQIRIASIYYVGADEVYLESETQIVCPGIVSTDDPHVPAASLALKSWPNPARNHCDISFQLSKTAFTRLAVYNLRGQLIRTFQAGVLASGPHQFIWDGKDSDGRLCPSGIYLLNLQCGSQISSRKLVLAK